MENIINRVALDHDLPVSTIRTEMEKAIHEGFMNPDGHMREVFGDREPTSEELIAFLAAALDDVESYDAALEDADLDDPEVPANEP
jgi:hypothetical protein